MRASSALGIGGAAIFCSFNPALRTGLIRVHSGQESRTASDSELEERVYSYVPGEPKVRHLSTRLTQNHSPEPSLVAPSRLRMRTGDLGLVSQPEISRVDVLSFYAYSAKLLLFACSCASSDSASVPLSRRASRPSTRTGRYKPLSSTNMIDFEPALRPGESKGRFRFRSCG